MKPVKTSIYIETEPRYWLWGWFMGWASLTDGAIEIATLGIVRPHFAYRLALLRFQRQGRREDKTE